MKTVVIVGMGSVGFHLKARLELEGIKVCFLMEGSPQYLELLINAIQPQAVFITISTKDKGEAARDYMLSCIKFGIPVITCEKGSFAFHATQLMPHIEKIGYSAVVGGGTMMLEYIKGRHIGSGPIEIHAIINGTLNLILDETQNNLLPLGQAIELAMNLGSVDPGATNVANLIQGEIKDLLMKTCDFFNIALATKTFITPDQLGTFDINPEDIARLMSIGENYRLVVSFVKNDQRELYSSKYKVFGIDSVDGWQIIGTFGPQWNNPWMPCGINNAVHLVEGLNGIGGRYTLSGPGATLEPTTTAMRADFVRLCP